MNNVFHDWEHMIKVYLLFLGFLLAFTSAATGQTSAAELLVLEKDDKSLAIIDPSSLKVLDRVDAGEDPHEVAVSTDGLTAYITNYGAFNIPQRTISVVDLASRKPLAPIELPGLRAPHGIQIMGQEVYFTAEGSKAIARFDLSSRAIDWVLGIGQDRTHMLAVRGNRIFTSNVNSNTVDIIEFDTKPDISGCKLTVVPVGTGPEGFDVSPDGAELWVANSHGGTISVVDVAEKKVVQTIDPHTLMSNRLKFTPDGTMILVSDLEKGDLIILDAKAHRETKRLSLGKSAAGILIQPDSARAYVALPRDNSVAVLDLRSLSVIGKIETGRGPDGLAWAARDH